MKESNLLIADFKDGNFSAIPSFPHPTQRSVMPVVAMKGNTMRPVGTCFAIANQGLVLTARHVIDDALGLSDGAQWDGETWLAVLYAAEPEEGDDADVLGGPLPVEKVNFFPSFDIAVMHLKLPVRVDTNEPLRMPTHRLSPGIPREGEYCFALGYHSMNWKGSDEGLCSIEIRQSYSISRGQIKQVHFPRRDNYSHTFPCFEVSARFDGGMSGGPVIGETGSVVGVVCSSMGDPDDEGHISYVSLIGGALFLQLEAITLDGKTKKCWLYDFVKGGAVMLDSTAEALRIEQSNDTLEIDFGDGRIMNAILGT